MGNCCSSAAADEERYQYSKKAQKYAEQRKECEAYKRNDHDGARWMSNQEYGTLMKVANKNAEDTIYKFNNGPGKHSENTIGLHGLFVQATPDRPLQRIDRTQQTTPKVIVGQGNNSLDGPRIKPTVHEFLSNQSIRYNEIPPKSDITILAESGYCDMKRKLPSELFVPGIVNSSSVADDETCRQYGGMVNEYAEKRRNYFRLSQGVFERNDRAEPKRMSNQEKEYGRLMNEANKKAADAIYMFDSEPRKHSENTIGRRRQQTTLKGIVGQENHSLDGPRIKPVVHDFLSNQSIGYNELPLKSNTKIVKGYRGAKRKLPPELIVLGSDNSSSVAGDEICRQYREKAKEYAKERIDCFRLSKKAYKRNDRNEAKRMSKQGREYERLMREANKKAADAIYNFNNEPGKHPENTIDLHGLFVQEALDRLSQRVDETRRRRESSLIVIVGRGNHSVDGPRIKPAIHKFASTEDIRYELDTPNAGCILLEF